MAGLRHANQSGERESHAGYQGKRFWTAIRIQAYQRLEQGSGHLKSQCNQANLGKIEVIIRFNHRINRRDQRLYGVVQHVRKTDHQQDRVNCCRKCLGRYQWSNIFF